MDMLQYVKRIKLDDRTREQCAALVWSNRTQDKSGINNAARHLLNQIQKNGGKRILKNGNGGKFREFFGGYYPNIYGDLFIFADRLINAKETPPRLARLRSRYLHTTRALALVMQSAIA